MWRNQSPDLSCIYYLPPLLDRNTMKKTTVLYNEKQLNFCFKESIYYLCLQAQKIFNVRKFKQHYLFHRP